MFRIARHAVGYAAVALVLSAGAVAHAQDYKTNEEVNAELRGFDARIEALARAFNSAPHFSQPAEALRSTLSTADHAWSEFDDADEEWRAARDQLEANREATLDIDAYCAALSGLSRGIGTIEQTAAAIDGDAGAIADLIGTPKDAPESLEPLNEALNRIGAINGRLSQLETVAGGMKGDLQTALDAVRGVETVDLERPAVASLRSYLVAMQGEVAEARSRVALMPARKAALESHYNDLRQQRDGLLLDIKNAAISKPLRAQDAHRLSGYTNREAQVSALSLPQEISLHSWEGSAEGGGRLEEMRERVSVYEAEIEALEARYGGLESIDDAKSDCEGVDQSADALIARADAAIKDAGASAAAIEFVFLSRMSKIAGQLEEYPELIAGFEDNIRVARGKLNMLQPLIDERQGRTDSQGRADLQTLLTEQNEVEELKTSSETSRDEVLQYQRYDQQEMDLLQSGAGRVEQVAEKSETMQSQGLGIAGVSLGGTE